MNHQHTRRFKRQVQKTASMPRQHQLGQKRLVLAHPGSTAPDCHKSKRISSSQETRAGWPKRAPPVCIPPFHITTRVGRLESSRSLFIQCCIEGEPVQVLINTGSTISLVQNDLLLKITNWSYTATRLETVMGQMANMFGCRQLHLHMGPKMMQQSFFLGLDALTAFEAVINREKKHIVIDRC